MRTLIPRSVAAAVAALLVGFSATAILADDDDDRDKATKFAAKLSGFNEVHSASATASERGAVSTKARGTFKAELDEGRSIIHYELSFEDLSSNVAQGHIHFGQRHTTGGIVVWLCQATARAPEAVAKLTPECGGPLANTVTGTITPAQVLEAVGQGIAPGEFAELVRALRAGVTYANVHSANFPPGEIRGQIKARDNDDDDHRKHR
jgi:hypothetical protein